MSSPNRVSTQSFRLSFVKDKRNIRYDLTEHKFDKDFPWLKCSVNIPFLRIDVVVLDPDL